MLDPTVFLNHIYLYIDDQTLRAIAESDFMKNEFSAIENSFININGNRSWSGLYITGEQTYIELFGISKDQEEIQSVGSCGLGLGIEKEGGIEYIADKLESLIDSARPELFERLIDDKKIPWFKSLPIIQYPEGVSEPFCCWVMEIDRDYLESTQVGTAVTENTISRRSYNASRFRADRRMKDIREITVALSLNDAKTLGAALIKLNYVQSNTLSECTYSGPDIQINIRTVRNGAGGIVEIKFDLNGKGKNREVYDFGSRSRLQFDGSDIARWTFSID